VVYVTVKGPPVLPPASGLGGVPVRLELLKVIKAFAVLHVFWILPKPKYQQDQHNVRIERIRRFQPTRVNYCPALRMLKV
jgi:hypothetical protein